VNIMYDDLIEIRNFIIEILSQKINNITIVGYLKHNIIQGTLQYYVDVMHYTTVV